jgi:alpha-galactosidase
MVKVAYIGAGSRKFATRLITDILTHPSLRKDMQFCLMDPNEARLALTQKCIELYMEKHPDVFARVQISSTTNQREAITGAKYVIASFLVGGPQIYEYDVDIPFKYGVTQCIGDTLGPGGVFRFLRSVPVYREIIRNMREVGYNAGDARGGRPLFLNYTNPMAMNTWFCNALWPDSTVGLCHGVQGTADQLRTWVGASTEEFSYLCAGINHMAWFLQLLYKDYEDPKKQWKDAYPVIWEHIAEEPSIIGSDVLRVDMMKATGFYMTESSGHLSEYVPYYRKRQDLLDKYAGDTEGFNNLHHGHDRDAYTREQAEINAKAEILDEEDLNIPFKVAPSNEYASGILNAMETNHPFVFNGNVINKGGALITNLPKDCCVEVPVTADFHGLHPQGGIELPPICQGLCTSNIMVQQAAVLGALRKDRELIYHAVLMDPNTASVCSPVEIRQMVDEMFAAQENWLSWFDEKGEL